VQTPTNRTPVVRQPAARNTQPVRQAEPPRDNSSASRNTGDSDRRDYTPPSNNDSSRSSSSGHQDSRGDR
jgi:hypothetical protein